MLTLGLDLGTSALKALLVDENGVVHARASAGYPTVRSAPGRAEQSPARWLDALARVCRELGRAGDLARVGAVGLTGQLNGVVLVDGAGEALGPVPIWLDRRAAAETVELERVLGDRVRSITGNELSPIAVLAKLLWLSRHDADRLERAVHALQPKDYLAWCLTGVAATEPNEASATLLMDLRGRHRDDTLVRASGIDPSLLAPIVPSDRVIGGLLDSAAALCGLAPGTPVIIGAGDVGALAVGCGACDDATLAVTLGTAGHVVLGSSSAPSIEVPDLWRMAHPLPGREIWLGLIMSGGLSVAWMRDIVAGFGAPSDFESLEALAARCPPGAGGLAFAPFLEGAATPWRRPDARARLDGLTASHEASALVRAVYEGVAFNVRACVEAFERADARIERIRLAEGGARSRFWSTMIADAIGRPVERVVENDTSALGAALLARSGAEGVPLATLVEGAVSVERQIEPDSRNAGVYEDAYRRFMEITGPDEACLVTRRGAPPP